MWIRASFDGKTNTIERNFSVDDFMGNGVKMVLALDASPWGLGGVLQEDDVFFEYFSDAPTAADSEGFSHSLGHCEGQQTWEALAVLVALRLWAPRWLGRRVRSDSISALNLLLRLTGYVAGAISIAKEIALDISESVCCPDVVAHFLGVANKAADLLSRWAQPGHSAKLLPYLDQALHAVVPHRSEAWWRAQALPEARSTPLR